MNRNSLQTVLGALWIFFYSSITNNIPVEVVLAFQQQRAATKISARNRPSRLMMTSRNKSKEIYNIPGSGWKSSEWNWGYAVGTGHDCALICRRKFSSILSRKELLESLLHPKEISSSSISTITVEDADRLREPSFEEVKLILGLTVQRGRWDGTDGGRNGYGEVLYHMAQAERYESSNEEMNAKLFVHDMSERFHLIANNEFEEDIDNRLTVGSDEVMKQILNDYTNDYDLMRRICTGLVLQKMGFVQFGM